MVSLGSWVLLLEAGVFLILAVVAGWEFHRSRQESAVARHQDQRGGGLTLLQAEEEESGNNGTRARHQTNFILAGACTAKAISLGVVWGTGSWVPFTAVSDLLYIALFGSLILLYVEMRNILAVASSHRTVRLGVFLSLAGVLAVSLVICTARWAADPASRKSLALRKFLYLELGITYLAMFVAFTYFGVCVCVGVAAPNKRLFYRVLVLTAVCGLAMCSKGALLVAAALNNSDTSALFPPSLGRYRFEALMALEELVPSIAIAYLTARGKGRRYRAQVLPSERTGLARWDSLDYSSINFTYGGMVPSGTSATRVVPYSPLLYGPSSIDEP
ncbi:unnamed protein product [Ectocarpus sp. 13 AM-2016]